ncbi:MAG: sigma-70 family RNA polymerase sigma factor [Oscillospiraceae bacterium]|nr:sigma-70 family RNA polymerase sigma factor [Oscillospiraceae bacterium]
MKPNFEEAVDKYGDLVYKTAYLYSGTESDSEDIFQETFLKLAKQKKEFKDEEHLKAWLIRVTVNFCKMLCRSAYFRHKTELDEAILTEKGLSNEKREVTEAVMKLPENYRLTVLLYYYYGYSCKETSKLLKISEPAVRTRLKRARNMLKTELEEVWQDE